MKHHCRASLRRLLALGSSRLILFLLCGVCALPFVWMFFATFKSNREIFTPFPLLPRDFSWNHYFEFFRSAPLPFGRQYLNSLGIATAQTCLAVALSAPAGYFFARYRFPGSRLLFFLGILVILIPRQVMILPLFSWFHTLRLLDNPLAVIFPGAVTGIGLLYFTLVFRRMPAELFHLARAEGASEYRTFLILLPLATPALLTYGLVHFVLAWHEHLIPLVMLTSQEKLTVSVGLASLYGSNLGIPYAWLMIGSLLTLAPTALLYLFLQRQFRSALADLIS